MSKLSLDSLSDFQSAHSVPLSVQLVQGSTPEYPSHFSQLPAGINPKYPPSTFIRSDAPSPVCTYVPEEKKKRVIPMRIPEDNFPKQSQEYFTVKKVRPDGSKETKTTTTNTQKSQKSGRLTISGKINRQKKVRSTINLL